jgi:hypothetical protein
MNTSHPPTVDIVTMGQPTITEEDIPEQMTVCEQPNKEKKKRKAKELDNVPIIQQIIDPS